MRPELKRFSLGWRTLVAGRASARWPAMAGPTTRQQPRRKPNQELDDMGPEDFRKMIEGQQLATPYSIETKGGRSYTITHPTNAFITEAYPNTVAVFVRGMGVIMLGLDSIEAIQHEHEVVAGR
jgi:hypothetical protein